MQADDRPQKWIVFAAFMRHLVGSDIMDFTNNDEWVLIPVKTLPPGILLDSIKEETWAEINIPYHPPVEEDESIFAMTLFLIGMENHIPATLEMMMFDAVKEDLYQRYKDQAEPMEAAFNF